jgi:hypothetical protein
MRNLPLKSRNPPRVHCLVGRGKKGGKRKHFSFNHSSLAPQGPRRFAGHEQEETKKETPNRKSAFPATPKPVEAAGKRISKRSGRLWCRTILASCKNSLWKQRKNMPFLKLKVLMPKMKLSSTLARDVLMCTKQRTTQ